MAILGSIRPRERLLTLLLGLDLFILLTAYYVLKVVREPLILLGGAVHKSVATGVQAALLVVAVPAYGALARRVDPRHLVGWIIVGAIGCLFGFQLLAWQHVPIGFAFFVWLGIAGLLLIAQFWSFANDIFSEETGHRLFPVVAFGATAGAIAGSRLAEWLIRIVPLSTMLFCAAVLLAAALAVTLVAHRRAAGMAAHRSTPPAGGARGGFALIARDRYLLYVALLLLVINLVNSTGEFLLAHEVTERAAAVTSGSDEKVRFIGEFYGRFFTWVNILAAVIQLVLVPGLFARLGVRDALLVPAAFSLIGYGAFAAVPLLAVITAAKLVENGTDYSLENTIHQALFLPTSRDAKYKAKTAIDTFFVRLGDIVSMGLVLGGSALGLSNRSFSLVNLGLVGLWLLVVARLRATHQRIAAPALVSRRRGAPARDQRAPSAT